MKDRGLAVLFLGTASTLAGWRRAWPREPLVSWLPALRYTLAAASSSRKGRQCVKTYPPTLQGTCSGIESLFGLLSYCCWPSEIPERALLALSSRSWRRATVQRASYFKRVRPALCVFSFTLRTVSVSTVCHFLWHAGVARPSVARASRPFQMFFLPLVGWKKLLL